jgi:hypothetical protein
VIAEISIDPHHIGTPVKGELFVSNLLISLSTKENDLIPETGLGNISEINPDVLKV